MADMREVAGRLIFAVADQDGPGLLAALKGVDRGDNLALILALADTAAAALETLHGDGWQDALNLAMLAASVEAVSDDPAEMG